LGGGGAFLNSGLGAFFTGVKMMAMVAVLSGYVLGSIMTMVIIFLIDKKLK
jgi:hypothetical protein